MKIFPFVMYQLESDSNLIFLIFQNLDAKSLLRCSRVCKLWYTIFKLFPTTLWKSLCKREFNVTELHEHEDYFQLYQTHFNFHAERYKFVSTDQNCRYHHKVEYGTFSVDASSPYFVWPTVKMNTYLVANVKEYVCWIDNSSYNARYDLYVTSLKNKDFLNSRVLRPEKRLEGNMGHLGLLLSNGESLLLAFNDESEAFIWNMDIFEMQGVINTRSFLLSRISMNTNRDYLIAGGGNGRVGIWNLHTRRFEKGLEEDIVHGVPKNVGISEEVIVYALDNGTYHVHDFKTLEKRYIFSVSQEISLRKPAYIPDKLGFSEQEALEEREEKKSSPDSVQRRPNSGIHDGSSMHAQVAGVHDYFAEPRNLPTILSLNKHILITNGYGQGDMGKANNILVWDLNTGKLMSSLSESKAMERFSLCASQYDAIKIAELSHDGTIVFCSVDDLNDSGRLYLWDFSSKERSIGAIKISLLPREPSFPTNVWVVSRRDVSE
jgi:WD40 repeat protein